MSNVRRVYVEKKPAFAVQAKELKHEVSSYLGIKSVTAVRVLIRYDVENISDEVLYVSTYNFSGKVDFNIIDSKVFDSTINNNKMLGSNIKSGDGATGFVLYEVPTGWRNFTIQYKENSFDRESITFDIANDDSNSEV